jgi:hypothetical protein
VTVDGRVSADSVEVVETCCDQARFRGKRVVLHLRDVSAVDETGCAMLRRLAETGVRIVADGVYTSQLVIALRRASPSPTKSFKSDGGRDGVSKNGEKR